MVPRKLRLRNFMAYRDMEQPLDFTGIHIAVLTGHNGAGKSTLLDAMTWALWGRSRAKADDDLVALGEHEMEVEFEFGLSDGVYRVLRKRTKPGVRKQGHSMLELFVASNDDEEHLQFVPLTGNTMRETDRKIENLLRLDYDTFVNSALLLQGRADEFTTKRPDLRKQVLSDVLGLSRYQRYAEAARERARFREAETNAAQREMATLEAQIALRPELEAELKAARAAQETTQTLVVAQEQQVQALQEAERLRRERAAVLRDVVERVRRAEHDLQELAGQSQRLTERAAEAQALLDNRATLEEAVTEYQTARAAEERLAAANRQLLQMRTEQGRLEQALERARTELVAQQRLLEREVTQAEALVAERPALEKAVTDATARLAALSDSDAKLAALRTTTGALTQEVGGLRQANDDIRRQGQELRAKHDQLQQSGAQGVCPVCGTELGEHGYQRILAEYQGELKRQRSLYVANEKRLGELQQQVTEAEAEAKAIEAATGRERADAQTLLNTAGNRLKDVSAATERLGEVGARLTVVRQQMADGVFAADVTASLEDVRQRIALLAYDPDEHQRLRERLRTLEPSVAMVQRLAEAERALTAAQADLAQVAQTRERRQAELDADHEQQARLQAEFEQAPDVAGRLTAAQAELDATRQRLATLAAAIGRLEGEIERCERFAGLLDERRRMTSQWVAEKALYDELATAFGRSGIQALLIETALPELEDEANALLGRMTDNRLTLKLETQRQARAGHAIETLDIKISDELGTRPYELYSGGEAFRINFALRIALSKLLARRAGAPLPTLIIDEGFGTQDVAGREKLIESVNAVAEEFQCVLIITHVEELKEVFPARIEVAKGIDGSQAVVIRS